jgi:hypothetical protein
VKPALIALALLVFFAAEACSDDRAAPKTPPTVEAPSTRPAMGPPTSGPPTSGPPPSGPPPSPPPAATRPATAPVAKPPESAPVADANKIPLEKGMHQVEDAGLEESLEAWADGKDIDLKHVIKRTGVYVKVWHEVRWTDAKKRERDPADYDRIVTESLAHAKNLVAAAVEGKTDQIKPLAELLIQRCIDCHNKYK